MTADASKTESTKRAHKFADCHLRGWNKGVEISAFTAPDGSIVFEVYETLGSNGGRSKQIAEVIQEAEN